ncbi:MAG: two-component regulator propeller domain-containing protein [Candidatus Omnitrophota bacterium]
MSFKKIFHFTLTVAALLIQNIALFSQSLPLKQYSIKDGLPSSLVTCILQDSQGYLWFGTEYGLCSLIGDKFQLFSDNKILKNDYIMGLLEDRKKNLWIATRGSGLICKHANGLTVYKTKDGLCHDRVSSVVEDESGNLWIGTQAGLCVFNGRTFRNYFINDGLTSDYITTIILDRKKNLWIGTDKGLDCLPHIDKPGPKNFIRIKLSDGEHIDNAITALREDNQGNIWAGTKYGLFFHHAKEKNPSFIFYSEKNGLGNKSINTIINDKDNVIWIGTEDGISLYSSGKFINYHEKNGFPHNKIFVIYRDREGNTWFGTDMGASRLQSLKIMNFTTVDGLPDNIVWTIAEGNPGELWIGTDKGLSCFSNEKFRNFSMKDGLINDSIYSLMKDREGNIWIATAGGISVYSPSTGKFQNYGVNEGLPESFVLCLKEDHRGTIWIGTTRGLYRFSNGQILPHNLGIPLGAIPVHAILASRNGDLWCSADKILWQVSGRNARSYSSKDGAIEDSIYSILEDSEGKIWIGTRGGLSCMENGKFKNYTKEQGLSDNLCSSIAEDDRHYLWISTQSALNRFDKKTKTFKSYTSKNGLISEEGNKCLYAPDNRGHRYLWFTSKLGISRFDLDLDRKNTVKPPVYINQFIVKEKDRLSDLNKWSGQGIQFKYDENYVKFGFIGLCYTSPEDVKYKCQLIGIDSKPFESKLGFITYRSLPPGNYTFKVIAKNNDGVESGIPATLHFRILPPFWRTWWFYSICIVIALFIVFGGVLFQNKRLKAKLANEAKNKQLMMAQRMKLMGVLAGGAVHDLKNLLSIIIGYSELVHDTSIEVSDEEKNEAVDIIKCTADTAFQVVSQILAFARQNFDEVRIVDLVDLLNEILAILKVTIPRTVELVSEAPDDKILLSISAVKFKQVIMNLCLNAVQAMGQNGELRISLRIEGENPEQVCIEVADTGPGISPEHIEKIFDPLFTTKSEEKGTGLGLFVVKQVVEEYKGKIRVHSKPNEGALFQIYFPYIENSQ